MATFLLRRGKGSLRRVAHLAHFDPHGEIDQSWCGRSDFDLSSNVPWGQPICKNCLRRAA